MTIKTVSAADKLSTYGEPWVINRAAKEDKKALSTITIPTDVGIERVNALKASMRSSGSGGGITGARREQKTVLDQSILIGIMDKLKDNGIVLRSREKKAHETTANERGRGGAYEWQATSLTYYGTAARFYNHQENTKIRMRIRFYLRHQKDNEGDIIQIERSKPTQQSGFLEIKIKSPRASEDNSVDKYRINVPDHYLARLVNLNSRDSEFTHQLNTIRDNITLDTHVNNSNPMKLEEMFKTIDQFARINPNFIKPSVAISYDRKGFSYEEPNYPLKEAQPLPKHRASILNRFPSRFKANAIRGNSKMHETPPTNRGVNTKGVPIEYQLTVDSHVQAHYPCLPNINSDEMPVLAHFSTGQNTAFCWYPQDVNVVEFKEPMNIAKLAYKQRSETHKKFTDTLIKTMKSDSVWGEFDQQVGKYGNFRRRIKEAHDPLLPKNERIKIVFNHIPSHSNAL